MGRKMDALLRRGFRASKFKTLAKLAVSRLAILKNQRQVRSSNARSDVIQLLNLGHQDRALSRVELVIKEHNMLDVFAMMEDYIHLLTHRIDLLQNNKECPDELEEAISTLIYAATRCGEFPELKHIRETFTSRFGKEFAARAAELRNNCSVNPKIIQKLSTRQTTLENRLRVFKEIASENGIILQLEEEASASRQEKQDVKPDELKQTSSNESIKLYKPEVDDEINNLAEKLSESIKARKFGGVAAAAQEAFEAAAYAAAAARAAVELSRADSQESDAEDDNGSHHQQLILYESTPQAHVDGHETPEEVHPNDNQSSEAEAEDGEEVESYYSFQNLEENRNKAETERAQSNSSNDSESNAQEEMKMAPNVVSQSETCSDSIVVYGSDSEDTKKQKSLPMQENNDLKTSLNHDLPMDELQQSEQNIVSDEDTSGEDSNEPPYKSPNSIQLKSQVDKSYGRI